MPRRRGYTLIEILIVVTLIAIMAAMAIPRLSFLRYRQDAAGRLVQRTLILAQQRSVRRNTNYLVVIDYAGARMRVVEDTDASGAATGSESWESVALGEGAKFAIPALSADSYTAFYATGPGISGAPSTPTLTFYPNGSASGNAFIYLGVASGRSDALRAVEVNGATGRTRLWRYVDGLWRRDAY